MQSKLTLSLDTELIEQAKQHAKAQGKSLSQMVADYFKVVAKKPSNEKVAPMTQSLIGILENNQVSEEDYKRHLEEKYL